MGWLAGAGFVAALLLFAGAVLSSAAGPEAVRASVPGWLRHPRRMLIASGVLTVASAALTTVVFMGASGSSGEARPVPTVTIGTPVASPVSNAYTGGWGPARDTFSSKSPAPYAVLNSITDNPAVGDERNFVRVRLDGEGTYGDFVRAKIGDKVQLSVAVFNDAADNLDGSAATVHGLRAKLGWPHAGTDLPISITLKGKNVADVWDGATVLTQVPAQVKIIAGSAYMHTKAGDFPILIQGDFVSELPLGWSSPDGEFPVGYSSDGKYRGNAYLQMTLEVVAAQS